MNTKSISLLILSFILTTSLVLAQDDTNASGQLIPAGDEVMEQFTIRQAVSSEIALISMVTITPSGQQETREFFSIYYRDQEEISYLIRMISPEAVRGVSLLGKGMDGKMSDQFLYLTDLGRVSKVRDTGRSVYFLASDFTYEDLINEIPDHFEYQRLADEVVQGVNCFKIKATPVEEKVKSGYTGRMLYISKDKDYNLLKAEFFGEGDKLIKTFEAFDYHAAGEEIRTMRPKRAVMVNHDKKTKTILTILGDRINFNLDPAMLTPEGIAKWSGEQDEALLSALKGE
ncbi:MAG: outer membrane lipoprotein-sorting protein [Verrucomicrobiota bacterium]